MRHKTSEENYREYRRKQEEHLKNTLSKEDYDLHLKHKKHINSAEFKEPLQKILNKGFRQFAYTRPENILYPELYQGRPRKYVRTTFN